tara:strand:+ start:124 stop:507 length:384 start_codon:yes stop_codon:yes gene_type:complete
MRWLGFCVHHPCFLIVLFQIRKRNLTRLNVEAELNMTDNIVDLDAKMKQRSKERDLPMDQPIDLASALKLGVLEVTEAIEGKKAMITFMFDENGDTEVIQAGLIDTFSTIGFLEYYKAELLNNSTHY